MQLSIICGIHNRLASFTGINWRNSSLVSSDDYRLRAVTPFARAVQHVPQLIGSLPFDLVRLGEECEGSICGHIEPARGERKYHRGFLPSAQRLCARDGGLTWQIFSVAIPLWSNIILPGGSMKGRRRQSLFQCIYIGALLRKRNMKWILIMPETESIPD